MRAKIKPARHGRPVLVAALMAAATLVLGGCGRTPGVVRVTGTSAGELHGTQVGDVISRPDLVLVDTKAARFRLRERPVGELTVLFFGYTHCLDVCPTTMADLAAAAHRLPAAARARLTVAFVTEDPERDSPHLLRAWLDRFDPAFTGLLGGGGATQPVLDALKASRTEIGTTKGAAASTENVEHSGSVYAFIGKTVVVYTGGTTPSQYAQDFTTLLSRT